MRNPSRTILLAVLMASLIVPPSVPAGAAMADPAARGAAKSVLLVGDSLSIDLGEQLETVFAGRPGVRFAHLGKVSSGLANPAFFNWDVQLTDQVKKHHPDIVLIMVGANDNKNLPTPSGRHAAFGTKDWADAYAARVTRLYSIIRADNPHAKVFYIGVPVMADAAFDAQTVRINAVLASTARSLSDATFVPTRDVLADGSGAFAAQGRTASGNLVRLRAKDGVHISAIGSQLLAARCLEAVSGVVGLPQSELVASLDSRAVMPVGRTEAAPSAVAMAEAKPATQPKPQAEVKAEPKVVAAKAEKPSLAKEAAAPAAAKPAVVASAAKTPETKAPAVVAMAKSAPVKDARPVVAQAAPAAKPAAGSYTVADGDTLWSVARKMGISADQLAEANPGVDARHLSLGQTLAVPAGVPTQVADRTPAAAKTSTGLNYTVTDGDNLWSVARQFDVSVAAVTEANPGIDPAHLRIGQSLAIPGSGQPVAAAAPARNTNQTAYTVADGDNLWSIAHRLGVNVSELKRANAGLDPLRLHPGQVLTLPASARAENDKKDVRPEHAANEAGLYPVAKGDTLWSLARRFGVSLEAMLSLNGELNPSKLQVGQLVTIPSGGHPVASAESLVFPVSSGDTLWGIARRFDLTVEALVAANPGVDPMHLREGQKLRVPSSLAAVATPSRPDDQTPTVPVVANGTPQLHSVVTGDTLWNLARHYGVSLDRMLKENAGIDPDRLQIGQVVRLPASMVSMAAR